METIGTILLLAVVAALCFNNPFDWSNSENEEKEMGWFMYKFASMYSWAALFILLLLIFTIIKALWRMVV